MLTYAVRVLISTCNTVIVGTLCWGFNKNGQLGIAKENFL